MFRFLRHKGAAKKGEKRPDLPDVSQPVPLPEPPPEDQAGTSMTVIELSELEARAICAREDIPVFWHRPDRDKRA